MLLTRRFVLGSATGLALSAARWARSAPGNELTAPRSAARAVAFDAFPIFDPRPVFALADTMFPGSGLSDEWRTRQFEYTWLRIATGKYADFWHVTEDALTFAANKLKLQLSRDDRSQLMNGYLELRTWTDVVPALESMKESGLRLALLSNFTEKMLEANIRYAGLNGTFEQVISTDRNNTFKPDPRAYQLGLDALHLTREEILFAAHAGWDAAGARLFGYTTYWVNRQKCPVEEMGAVPDAVGETLTDLAKFLT